MNDWHVFTWIYQSFWQPFLAAVNAMAGNLSGAVILPATAGATIYIAAMAYQDLYGGGANPILDLARRCVRIGLILACLTTGTYVGTISNLVLTTVPNELAQAVTGAAAVGATAFDKLGGQVWGSCAQVWNNLSVFDVKSIVLGIFAGLYLIYSATWIAIAFAIWLITQIGLGLVIAIGPLAIACLLTPQTARFFNGWLASVVTFIVAELMIVTLTAVLVTTVNNTLAQILTANAATGANANDLGAEIHQLVNAGLMFTIAGFNSLAIVPIARAIGGGAAAEIAPVTRWAHGQVASATKAAPAAAASAASATGSVIKEAGHGLGQTAAGMRSLTVAGKAH